MVRMIYYGPHSITLTDQIFNGEPGVLVQGETLQAGETQLMRVDLPSMTITESPHALSLHFGDSRRVSLFNLSVRSLSLSIEGILFYREGRALVTGMTYRETQVNISAFAREARAWEQKVARARKEETRTKYQVKATTCRRWEEQNLARLALFHIHGINE